jgi:glutamine amidotransferase
MTDKKIVIIDYQLGNLFSVRQACLHIGYEAVVTTDPAELAKADYAILPGVGAFADAIDNLNKFGLTSAIKDFVSSGKPFMGICLGLQLLFTESEEFGNNKGLNLIEGKIRKFPAHDMSQRVLKVPQISWNQISETENNAWADSPLRSCKSGDYMYFVHSFYADPVTQESVLSTTEYGGYSYCSAVTKDNIFACQFHPEKSGLPGIEIYRNWINQ